MRNSREISLFCLPDRFSSHQNWEGHPSFMVPNRLPNTSTFHNCVGLYRFPRHQTWLFLSDMSLDPQHLHIQPWGSPSLPYDFYWGPSCGNLSFSQPALSQLQSDTHTELCHNSTIPYGSRLQQGLCYISWPRTNPNAHETQKYSAL